MSKFLLDTHYLLWYLEDSPKMSQKALSIIANPDSQIFFSQISLIEISIKLRLGKLPDFNIELPEFYTYALEEKFDFIEISNFHIFHYQNIPLIELHRDPFDRLIIATAAYEGMKIISADEKFKLYPELIDVIS